MTNHNKSLSIGAIIGNGMKLGSKNFISITVNLILFILTIWIPYINVGTLIGMTSGITLKMSKGTIIKPTEIFDKTYRQYFGEYFLMSGLKSIGLIFAFLFVIIPYLILYYAWFISDLLFLDRKSSAFNAFEKSNEIMYDNKLNVFIAHILLPIVLGIIVYIVNSLNNQLAVLVLVFEIVLFVPMVMGMRAYVYGELTKGISENA